MPDWQLYVLYLNRQDLLEQALDSLGDYQDRAVIIDNSAGGPLTLPGRPAEIVRPPVPLFVSQSYNLVQNTARTRQQDLFFVMHSDARASPEVIEACLEQAEELEASRVNWGVIFTNYDVLALHNVRVLDDFRWDPYLPLYFTDVDFYYRLRIAGVRLVESGLHVEHHEEGSSAMKADLALREFIQTNYFAWRDYYVRKWGGERDHETFRTPFNQ